MTPQELVKAASEARPDLMNKTAIALAAASKIDPSFANEAIEEFNRITNTTVEKVAAVGGMGPVLKAVGTAGAVALAGSVATDLYDAAKRALTKGTSFKRMMDFNPALSAYKKEEVRRAFETMHRFAPEFTADPNLGGQVINRMVELPQDNANLIMQLINANKNVADTRRNQFAIGKVDVRDPEAELESKKAYTKWEHDTYPNKGKTSSARFSKVGSDLQKRLDDLRAANLK